MKLLHPCAHFNTFPTYIFKHQTLKQVTQSIKINQLSYYQTDVIFISFFSL